VGLLEFQCRKIAYNLNLSGKAYTKMLRFVRALYNTYRNIDATLLEINPVFKTSDNNILAVDCKMKLDNNALFRHPEYASMRDLHEEDPAEVEASENHLNYVKLDGNVGCMVNGAGLAMATMDIIKLSGGEPANFLDVGGSANAQRVEQGFRIILKMKTLRLFWLIFLAVLFVATVWLRELLMPIKILEIYLFLSLFAYREPMPEKRWNSSNSRV